MIAIKKPTQLPPRIMLYGPGGVGKTTLAAQAPGAVIIPIENGAASVPDANCSEIPKTWLDFSKIIASLMEDTQGIPTLVIDSVTKLQDLLFDEICKEYSVKTIEDVLKGFGKGYVIASERWNKMLSCLEVIREKGCGITLIGHVSTKDSGDPRLPDFKRFQPRLQSSQEKGILQSTFEWCDAVLFCGYEVFTVGDDSDDSRKIGTGEGKRIIFTEERPAFLAKNRYKMQREIPMRWSAIADSISNHYATKKEAHK